MPPTVARAFYDRITSGDSVAHIREMINSDPPTFENDVFDCKREPRPPDPNERKQKLLDMWSEALVGFANSGGGVIIWGLVAKPDSVQKMDKVVDEDLIDDPNRLEHDLRKLQTELTDPPLGNVEYKAVRVDSGTSGFLVCFIPEGLHKPYRQNSAGRQYCYRAGDTFRIMPRHMLQAMFYPRLAPRFGVEGELTWQPGTPRTDARQSPADVKLEIRITNEGTATARDTVVRIGRFYPGNSEEAQRQELNEWQSNVWGYRTSYPIHPGMPPHSAFWYSWVAQVDHPLAMPVFDRHPCLSLAVYADNAEPHYFLWTATYDDIVSFRGRKHVVVRARRLEDEQEFRQF